MAWRIVRQPNGLLARFSDICDHFTHINMTREEAIMVCLGENCSRMDAEIKVGNGIGDIEPWGTTPGDGLSRWRDSLETIDTVSLFNNPNLPSVKLITELCSVPAEKANIRII